MVNNLETFADGKCLVDTCLSTIGEDFFGLVLQSADLEVHLNVQKNLKTHSQLHSIILMEHLFEEHIQIVQVSFHVSLHNDMGKDISMMVWKVEVEMLV